MGLSQESHDSALRKRRLMGAAGLFCALLCCVNLDDSPPLSGPPGPCTMRVGPQDLTGWEGLSRLGP